MKYLRKPYIFKLAFVIVLGAMLIGLFRSEPPQQYFTHSDKVGHILGFFVLAISGYLAIPKRFLLAYSALLICLAVGSEYIQASLLPARFFSLQDMFANLGGILIAGIIMFVKRSPQHTDTP